MNNGVYRAGFATAQEKYEEAVRELFRTLDWLEKRFARTLACLRARSPRRTCGSLLPLVRFDAVYYSHFKCNLRRLVDYPNLWRYARRVYSAARRSEDRRHGPDQGALLPQKSINPTQIVLQRALAGTFPCA